MPAIADFSREWGWPGWEYSQHTPCSSRLPRSVNENAMPETEWIDIRLSIHQLRRKSLSSTRHDGEDSPEPLFQFFVHVLRRHFSLRLCSGTFDTWGEEHYQRDVRGGSVFARYPMFPFETYKPPSLSYVRP
ncbi:hypothetical protein VTL71DRAFT_9654 [Oculimacula yallundae]|uniref:Uncharacterized protein n=1 Tax=Oculimacula yallundae TaxID=86028 RepID=A0ABR4BT85_9HELO